MDCNAIKYFSTNAGIFGTPDLKAGISSGEIQTFGLAEATFRGQAPDGGLMMPIHLPRFGLEEIMQMKGMIYSQVFVETMMPYYHEVLRRQTMERIGEAYTFKPFMENISKNDIIARLDEGPSASFKDFAAQAKFRIDEALIGEEPLSEIEYRRQLGKIPLITYVVATSGDTGSAMGLACHNKNKQMMVIIHSSRIPEKITEMQAKQMSSIGDNIYVVRVDTDFDGCARIANELQRDPELNYMHINSANSVNIGRLLPQRSYYYDIYSKVAEKGEVVYFSVPSGNFGNATAGLMAMREGLPIKLIIAVNENDVFERFYRTGIYAPAESSHTSTSSAIEVNWPSNVRRLFQYYGGQLVEGKDPDDETRKVISKLVLPNLRQLRQEIACYSVSDTESDERIQSFWKEGHIINYMRNGIPRRVQSTIEPHGAVAVDAGQKFRAETGYDGKIVYLETAHSGKFPERIRAMGIEPDLPEGLAKLVDQPHGGFYTAGNNYTEVKGLVKMLREQELRRVA